MVAESPAFAPQVTKVLGPPWLRVDEVTAGPGGARDERAVAVTPRSAAVLGLASVGRADDAGLAAAAPGAADRARVDPPFLFLALLPVVIAVVLAELSEGGLDPRVLAMLGVLSAVNAILRGLSAGTGGIELVFFLLIAGRAGLRPRLRLRARLHVAVRLRPADRRGRARGCRTRCWSRPGSGWAPACCRAGSPAGAEIAMLAVYGVFAAYAFGLLMNLSGWPFLLGIEVPGHESPRCRSSRRHR